METRSKKRVGPVPDPVADQHRGTPVDSQSRSSSEASLNLTVILDDGVSRVVGASSPEVGPPTTVRRLTGITSTEHARGNAEISLVTEPICPRGSPSGKMVEPRTPAPITYAYCSCEIDASCY